MGRKPKTKINEEKAPMPESTNQSMERVILQPGNKNPSLGPVESQPESLNPSLGNVELQLESGSPAEQQANSAKPSNPKKRMTRHTSIVRRSKRVQHAITSALNPDIVPVVEEISLTETDEEYDPPPQKEQNMPESTEPTSLGEKNFEKQIDNIVERLEIQAKTIEELKSEVSKKSVSSGSPSGAYVRYKSLYIDSQKKIEVLTGENEQLSMKLETALGKLEAYENGNHVFSEMLEKLKDVILVSNLTKATETAVNMSSQALHTSSGDAGRRSRSPAANRKKLTAKRR
ncbi:uncharacterized protein LOC115972052 isoform X1 [Quercus lobata]|uniref:uncharacterized protein LOC115972052 isoform X1 n=1 Tax=Quercus lobata TaxID=97700 RepID=UPI001246F586|nr:uncharacterized protein LOC115972052 isoform X1 [Quercus lobata]